MPRLDTFGGLFINTPTLAGLLSAGYNWSVTPANTIPPRPRMRLIAALFIAFVPFKRRLALAADGNRLIYLDSTDPYYPTRDLPALTAPAMGGRGRNRSRRDPGDRRHARL